ncbi:unnamed protein product [Arctogadus glacialis]
MSAHGLLSSVFSCSQGSKSTFKRRLRQTRSLDPAMMMRPRGSEVDEPTQKHATPSLTPPGFTPGMCFNKFNGGPSFLQTHVAAAAADVPTPTQMRPCSSAAFSQRREQHDLLLG